MTSYPQRQFSDYYSDPLPWECDDCGGSEYSCDCEDSGDLCADCGGPLDRELCDRCDALSLAPVTRISLNEIGA